MDPVTIKFYQLIAAQIVGTVILIAGLWFFFRGIAGKSGTVLVQGAGFKAKLVNSSPGAVVMIIGVIVLALGLGGEVSRKTVNHVTNQDILKNWLENAENVHTDDDYLEVLNKVVGKDRNNRVKSDTKRISAEATLGQLATKEYGEQIYWKLLAAINKDRGYYSYSEASSATTINNDSYIEVWQVSKYYGVTQETLINVVDKSVRQANEDLLDLANTSRRFNSDIFNELSDSFRQQELGLLLSMANTDGIDTYGELAIKYYGSKDFVKLIEWVNKDQSSTVITPNTIIDADSDLMVLQVIR